MLPATGSKLLYDYSKKNLIIVGVEVVLVVLLSCYKGSEILTHWYS